MSQNLSLAHSYAVPLACTLMVPVTLFQVEGQYGVLPSAELEDDEVETLAEYDPFEYGPAH
ncbi:hypothetical protein [Rhizobium jaguaris]|uniref:Uncharacterized protein n=1 Tax=Rhizobium jaguaris TaxID=1312183 RepID=A0A387FYP4_9HYPH|nr:hypothetical protein [Rhizobium jaguaris]AYG64180.1 hypothetical protein CCGE525_36125 [Rhizobium jaguaris]